jgi:lipid-binding SYLF domain-containing protein
MRIKQTLTAISPLLLALSFVLLGTPIAQAVREEAAALEEKVPRTEAKPAAKETADVHAKATLASRASEVLEEVMKTPDQGIPLDLLSRAKCVAVFPSTLKAGFVVGAKYGYGLVSCRQPESGTWGAPAFFTIAGGSVGLQIGAKATDLILLFTNDTGVQGLLNSKVTLGADIGVSAGPVGRDASASTDVSLQAAVLSYSRSEGIFAGVELDGSVMSYDAEATREMYGQEWPAKAVLMGNKEAPVSLASFPHMLGKYASQRMTKSSVQPPLPPSGLSLR